MHPNHCCRHQWMHLLQLKLSVGVSELLWHALQLPPSHRLLSWSLHQEAGVEAEDEAGALQEEPDWFHTIFCRAAQIHKSCLHYHRQTMW